MNRFSSWTASRLTALQARVHRLPGGHLTWRILVILTGSVLVLGGLVLVPLPGPGWLIVFLGLSVLASEFVWAERLLRFARRQVAAFGDWLSRLSVILRRVVTALAVGFALAVVAAYLLWKGWWPFGSDA